MARPYFIIEGIHDREPVKVTLPSISPEMALISGRRALREAFGTVTKVTVRYAEGQNRMTASDFIDPNRTEGEE